MSNSADSTTVERRPYVVKTSGDPSAVAPSFGLSRSYESNPTVWVDGQWVGTYDTSTNQIDALTPLIGPGQALDVTETGLWVVYVRWTVNDETPVRAVDQINFY